MSVDAKVRRCQAQVEFGDRIEGLVDLKYPVR